MNGRYFLYALLVIVFIAALEYPPRMISYSSGASPTNTGWDGTSDYVSLLNKTGYEVYTVVDWCVTLRSPPPTNKSFLIVLISPEKEYSQHEVMCLVSIIRNSLYATGNVSLLIADEGPYTNSVLDALGIPVSIDYETIIKSAKGDPFPTATLKVPEGKEFILYLDYAAKLNLSGPAVLAGVSEGGEPVAAYIVGDDYKAYIVSDGSVFINNLISLNSSEYDYRGFAMNVTHWLGNPENYAILIEGGKYGVGPANLLDGLGHTVLSGAGLGTILSYAILLFHPIVWFPLAHSLIMWIDEQLSIFMVENSVMRLLTLAAMSVIVFMVVKGAAGVRGGEKDTPLQPVAEVDVIVDTPVRRGIVEGKIKLTKEDFLPLYELVDSALRRSFGFGLGDPAAIPRLAQATGLDEDFLRRYVDRMNSLSLKLRKRKFFPIVLSWNRTMKKLINDSNELLSRLGASLYEKKVEELLRRT